MSTAELLPTLDHRPAALSGGSLVDGPLARAQHLERRLGPPRIGRATDEIPALLEEFAATIAHELRTPLAIVEQTADTALERSDDLRPDQVAEVLRIIQRNSRLATMLLGRLERDRGCKVDNVSLEPELVDLAGIARQTTFDLAEVLLRWHPTELHAPAAVMIHADPTAVREILSNLLANAAKYSPRYSYIDISVTQHRDSAQVTVRDRGSGIRTADAERVFGKYQQTDPHDPGAGLGLYISRRLARAHGGDLDVHPATRRGSVFRLTLPSAAGDDGPPGSQALDWACGGVACGLSHGSEMGAKIPGPQHYGMGDHAWDIAQTGAVTGPADGTDHPDQ